MLTATTLKPRQLPLIMSFLAALLCALLLNLGSNGNIRQGGDDEGSGIGGTGRLPVPGSESGLGGTGLKPFLGSHSDSSSPDQALLEVEVFYTTEARKLALTQSLELDIPASREVEIAPLESPFQIAAASSFTRDSSAIDINEQIQRDLDSNALAFLQLRDQAADYQRSTDFNSANAQQPKAEADNNEPSPSGPQETDLAWQAVASFFSQNVDEDTDAVSSALEVDSGRIERPERVQRPELPPMQRVRPSVQRAGILPPRVKPLRL
jgi:hypothetical protein